MTTILAIDASTGPCSVAVWAENRVCAYLENLTPTTQAARLIPMIEQALQESGSSYSDLTSVAATVGPGSFTGIRIGLASARGIAFAAGIPSAGYTTLDVLAHAALDSLSPKGGGLGRGPITGDISPKAPSLTLPRFAGEGINTLAILNAGKGEVYYQVNQATPRLGALEEAFSAAGQSSVIVAGNVMIDREGFTACGVTFPRADLLAEMAANGAIASQLLRPFYIRPPDAKLPKQHLISKSV